MRKRRPGAKSIGVINPIFSSVPILVRVMLIAVLAMIDALVCILST